MEVYYLDEWIKITLHVAGFLHPAIFEYFHHSSDKLPALKVTNCTVQSAEYWCSYGTKPCFSWNNFRDLNGRNSKTNLILIIDLDALFTINNQKIAQNIFQNTCPVVLMHFTSQHARFQSELAPLWINPINDPYNLKCITFLIDQEMGTRHLEKASPLIYIFKPLYGYVRTDIIIAKSFITIAVLLQDNGTWRFC